MASVNERQTINFQCDVCGREESFVTMLVMNTCVPSTLTDGIISVGRLCNGDGAAIFVGEDDDICGGQRADA